MESNQTFEEWVVERHVSTNHFYDSKFNLPYDFHLSMAQGVGEEFKWLLPAGLTHLDQTKFEEWQRIRTVWEVIVKPAIKGHDVIEDARASYNDVLCRSNYYTAEIIRAVTNYGRGRTREERMPAYIYEEIRKTPFATFVKLCDRIANLKYSSWMQSRMLNVYREENAHFRKMLYEDTLDPMWRAIDDLLALKL